MSGPAKFLTWGVNGRFLLVGGRPVSAAVSGSPLTLTLRNIYSNNLIAHPVIQRKAGTDYADVPVMFTYTGLAPDNVQARVVNMDATGTVIKDWAALTGVTVNGANLTGLGYLPSVPIGCDYQLQIRDGNQPANAAMVSNGTRRWGVGVCIFIAGQSNMLGTFDAGEFNSPIAGTTETESSYWVNPDFTGVYWGVDGFTANWTAGGGHNGDITVAPGWGNSAGGGTGFLRMIATGLKAKYGRKIPVCAAVWAFGSTGLGDMFPPATGEKTQIFTNTGTSTGTIGWHSPPGYTPGDFEGIILHQGEAEAGRARDNRVEQLKTYYSFMLSLVAPFGRTAADLFFLPAVLGSYTYGALGGMENMRSAVYDLEAYAQANGWPRVKAGWNCIDLDAGDPLDPDKEGLHFHDIPGGNPYRKWSLRRVIQSCMKQLGCATFSGMGPRITGVTRSGNVATVTIAHEGGTALAARNSAGALTGWYANKAADFSGTDISVTAAVASASTVAVTFPNSTVFPVYLKYMGAKIGTMTSQHPDTTNPVYDNAVYPTGVHPGDQYTGLPLQPTVDSLMVN
jgi:hypothetical protein